VDPASKGSNGKSVKNPFKMLIASFLNPLVSLGTHSSKYILGTIVPLRRQERETRGLQLVSSVPISQYNFFQQKTEL